MKKFRVRETVYREFIVEAETAHQAEEIAETKGILVREKLLDSDVEEEIVAKK